MSASPEFLTSDELARLIGLSSITLAQWRARGQGPAFARLGRAVRYSRADVEAWLAAHTVGTRSATDAVGGAPIDHAARLEAKNAALKQTAALMTRSVHKREEP